MRNPRRLSLEDALLLLLARGTLTSAEQAKARTLLEQGLSWPLVLRQSQRHGVFPLLYRNLRRFGFSHVPAEVRAELETAYRMNAMRNLSLVRELTQVLQLLAEAGVPVIPLKGVALAASLYGDIALRVCVDLDILVPRPLVYQAFHLLQTLGYRAEFTEPFFAKLLLRSGIEYALMREEPRFRYLLELHWGILWGLSMDRGATEALWAEAYPRVCFGVPATALSPEWELLFLATHAARHRWQRLKWLADIHELVWRQAVDWDKVWATAKRLGWEEVLGLTLSACHALFDTPAFDTFSLRALPPWLTLFPDEPARPRVLAARVNLRLLQRPSDRLRYIVHVLLTPTLAERRLLRLPSSLGFLYYLLRPLRLGCKWG